jgi:hypothetical protein
VKNLKTKLLKVEGIFLEILAEHVQNMQQRKPKVASIDKPKQS